MMANEIKCDVLVVGAGLSGLAAAVSASEKGARTVLLEKNSFLGGTVIAGMHRYLCGLYGSTGSSMTLNSGIARKLCAALRKRNANNRPMRFGKVNVFAFRGQDLKVCLSGLVKGKKNLQLILNSRAHAVKKGKGLICEVQTRGRGKDLTICPKVVIDASGQGSIIALSKDKCRVAPRAKRQLAGFSFRINGLKDTAGILAIKVPYYIKLAVYTPLGNSREGLIQLNIPAGLAISQLRKKARAGLLRLRKVLPEFKNAYIVEFSPYVVEREGVCLEGEYTLTGRDVLTAKKFKDGVVKNSWPMEIWDRNKGPQFKYLKPGAYYEIPGRALRSKNIKNLFACGRCISASHEALGSTRVAGTCIAIGEQAGLAAANLCASY